MIRSLLARAFAGIVLMSGPAYATDVPPEARAALAEAQALLRADLSAEALDALERAVTSAPDWSAPYVLRARLRADSTLTEVTETAANHFDEDFDYPGAIGRVQSLQDDATKAMNSTSFAEVSPADQTWVTELEARAGALLRRLRTQHTSGRQEALRIAEAERMQRETEAREAAERREALAHEAARAAAGGRRTGAVLLGIGGVAAGAGSIITLIGSAGAIEDVRLGRVATASDFEGRARDAGNLRTASLGLGVAGAVLLGSGVLLWLSSDLPEGLAASVTPAGASLSFSGSF